MTGRWRLLRLRTSALNLLRAGCPLLLGGACGALGVWALLCPAMSGVASVLLTLGDAL